MALPDNAAVTVPAAKFPDPSRATIAPVVFALVAVVALLRTFPAVEIVASFVSTIPAAVLTESLVTAPAGIKAVSAALPTDPSDLTTTAESEVVVGEMFVPIVNTLAIN